MKNKAIILAILTLTAQTCGANMALATPPGNSNTTVENDITNNNRNDNRNTNNNRNDNRNTNNNSNRNDNRNTNNNNIKVENDITNKSGSSSESSSESDSVSNSNSSLRVEYDVASASAAPVFSSSCSSGASVQGVQGGFSAGTVNVVCRNLMMADAYLRLAGLALNEEMQIRNMDKAIEYLEKAGMVVDRTSTTGFVAQVASDLSIPLAALLLLLLL